MGHTKMQVESDPIEDLISHLSKTKIHKRKKRKDPFDEPVLRHLKIVKNLT